MPGSGCSLSIKHVRRDGEYLSFCSFTHEDSSFHSVPLLCSSQRCILMWLFTARQPQRLSPSNGASCELHTLQDRTAESSVVPESLHLKILEYLFSQKSPHPNFTNVYVLECIMCCVSTTTDAYGIFYNGFFFSVSFHVPADSILMWKLDNFSGQKQFLLP